MTAPLWIARLPFQMFALKLPLPRSLNVAAIYRIVDLSEGYFYIGSSVNIRGRFYHHISRLEKGTHENQFLQRVYNDRKEALRFELIEPVLTLTRASILAAEQLWLDKVGVKNNRLCMNALPIAGSSLGAKRSAETRQRMSIAQAGHPTSEEAKQRMRAAKLGRPLSASHRAKIGVAMIGKPGPKHPPETLAKFRKYSAGQVRCLRRLYYEGATVLNAAKVVGIKRSPAYRIVHRESYIDV